MIDELLKESYKLFRKRKMINEHIKKFVFSEYHHMSSKFNHNGEEGSVTKWMDGKKVTKVRMANNVIHYISGNDLYTSDMVRIDDVTYSAKNSCIYDTDPKQNTKIVAGYNTLLYYVITPERRLMIERTEDESYFNITNNNLLHSTTGPAFAWIDKTNKISNPKYYYKGNDFTELVEKNKVSLPLTDRDIYLITLKCA